MYRSFIRNRTRKAFADLSDGRVDDHIKRFHNNVTLRIDREGSVATKYADTHIEERSLSAYFAAGAWLGEYSKAPDWPPN